MEPSLLFEILFLICEYLKSREKASKDDAHQDFLVWLTDNKHKKIREEIELNTALSINIQALLARNHEEVFAKLDFLGERIAILSSQIAGLDKIAESILPNQSLSDQAISILKCLRASGGSRFVEIKTLQGTSYQILDGEGNPIIPKEEPRFMDDDLQKLCDLGLLRPDRNSKGNHLFIFTRAGDKLVELIEKDAQSEQE